jgi:hypothetical protein
LVESLKNFFLKFISGRLGLATTFWLCGVLVAITLNFLTSHVTTLWQLILVTVVMIIHLILIVIAVWNASKLYTGMPLWKWLSRVIAILNAVRWLWYLPLLIASISAALGFPIHSSNYWELNWHKYICQPAEYQNSPDKLVDKYSCTSSVSTNGELIALRCQDNGMPHDYIFTKTEQDCQKNLTKLKDLHRNKK